MVGQGVLRECLLDPEVTRVLVITRSPTVQRDSKVREIVHRDFFDFLGIRGSARRLRRLLLLPGSFGCGHE